VRWSVDLGRQGSEMHTGVSHTRSCPTCRTAPVRVTVAVSQASAAHVPMLVAQNGRGNVCYTDQSCTNVIVRSLLVQVASVTGDVDYASTAGRGSACDIGHRASREKQPSLNGDPA